jgi:zinc protease
MTTIVVVGNVTPERARSVIEHNFGSWKSHGPMIEQNFGSWKSHGPMPRTALPSIPINRPSNAKVPNDSRVQAEVTLAEILPLTRSNPDYYSLNLGTQVLGGAFYASRLSRDLRENSGLVYDVSSTFEANPTRALYMVTFGCDPRNVSKIRAIVERDLKDMQTNVVSDEALNQAKVLLLQQISLSESGVHSIAESLISRATNGLPLDEPAVEARKYVGLTAQEVQAAFAKWIRPSDFVQVTEGPESN